MMSTPSRNQRSTTPAHDRDAAPGGRAWLVAVGLMLFLALPIALVQAGDQNGPRGRETVRPHRDKPAARAADRPADPYGLDRARLGVVQASSSDALVSTPSPSPAVQRKYGRFIEGFVDADNTLDVIEGRPRILVLRQAPIRLQIPNEDIARYDILTDRELSITGLGVGTTLLNIWFADPDDPDQEQILSYLVRVLPDPEAQARLERDFAALEDKLNSVFPDAIISLTVVGNSVVVEGQAKDSREATKIIRVVERNAPKIRGRNPNPAALSDVSPDDFGFVENDQQFSNAGSFGFEVINLLTIPGESQVSLSVTVAEVNRAAARSIGLDFQVTNNSGIDVVSTLTGAATAAFAPNIPIFLDNGQIALQLEALRGLDLSRSLAEPNLVTMNGAPAQFSAGGEFPVPVVTGATATGLQGVEFVPFGVSLEFTPFILDRDRIRLVVAAEVSTRSLATGTTVQGANIPGLDTRNIDTVVELRDGQTLAMAGLIQQNFGSQSDRIPGLGDLPLVGWMFGVNRTTSSEQELLILIRPELVRPLNPDEVPSHLPGSDMFEPDDVEFYLFNRLESRHAEDARPAAMTDPDRIGRQRLAQQKFIVGPSGHADGR
jgi:pilus assembly protein CpaC